MAENKKKILLFSLAAVILALAVAGFMLYRNTPTQITVLTAPDKTIYDYGSTLDTTGLTLELTRRGGRTEVITEGFICTPVELNESGTVEITVMQDKLTTSFTVESVPVLTGITLASDPDNTWYLVGSSLDTTGLTLEASYNDGSTQVISEGFSCSHGELTELGATDITVTYENQTAVFSVDVVEVTELSARPMSAKVNYMVGQVPDPDGLLLNVTYSDGSYDTINEGFLCSEEPFTEPGPAQYTISYQGLDTTFDVEVYPAVTFDHLDIDCTATYRPGDPEGYNASGVLINRCILFWFDLPIEMAHIFPTTITASWGHAYNGNGQVELSGTIEDAKAGKTYVEYGTMEGQWGPDRYLYMLYLPDDPAIAGEQSVTMTVGSSELTVYFTLVYLGDYETGTGWKIENIRY